jgi:hypothetical protein
MKQKLNKLKLLTLTILAGLLLNGCQVEQEHIEKSLYEKEIKVSQKTFEELIQEGKFNNAYTKIVPKEKKLARGSSLGRTAMEDQYGFTIANTMVKVAETDSVTSYTMLISRDVSTSDNVLENLTLQVDSQNKTTALLLKYVGNVGVEDFDNFTGSKSITPILDEANQDASKAALPECYWLTTSSCDASNHGEPGVACTNGYETVELVCTGGGGGGTNINNSSSQTYGGGGGGQTIITTPVLPCATCPALTNAPTQPCEELKKQLSDGAGNPNLKQAIIELQPNTVLNYETGKQLVKDANGAYSSPNSPTGNDKNIIMKSGEYYYGSLHVHTKLGVPMFSFRDVYSLYQFYQNAYQANLPDITIIMLAQDSAGIKLTYALKIDNPDTFFDALVAQTNATAQTLDLTGLTPEDSESLIFDDIERKLTRYYAANRDQNTDNEDRELAFLKRFGNFGISIYKANSDLNNWNKLVVDNTIKNSPRIVPQPCN